MLAAKRILGDVHEAELVASGEYSAPRGTLAITAPIVFGRMHILPVVTEFLAAQSTINIELTLADRTVDLVEEHMVLRCATVPWRTIDSMPRAFGEVRVIACASPQYLANHGPPAKPADLLHHTCISFGG